MDSEIANSRADATRFGWTGWALAAAIAATAWLLLSVWESEQLNLRQVAKWVIVLSIPADAIIGWGSTFLSFPNPKLWGRRFRLFSDLDTRRLAFAFLAVRSAALSWVAFFGGIGVTAAARWSAGLFYALMAAIWVLIIALSLVDLPFQQQRQGAAWQKAVGAIVGYAFYLWIVTRYSLTIPWTAPGNGLPELKAAVLLVTAGALAFFLLGHVHPTPTLGRLLDLRRKLMLEHVTPFIAQREVEIAVIGMQGNVVLERFLLRLLDFATEFDDALRLPLFRVSYFEQVLAAWPASKGQGVTLATIRKGCEIATREVTNLVKMLVRMGKRLQTFEGQMSHVQQQEPNALLAPGNYESLERIYALVLTSYQERLQVPGQLADRLSQILATLAEKARAEQVGPDQAGSAA